MGAALKAFYDATALMGMADKVTTFTLSDFARTMRGNTVGGTDHAWGNHHFILGGAVQGQALYGEFPTLIASGPDDAGADGLCQAADGIRQLTVTGVQTCALPI